MSEVKQLLAEKLKQLPRRPGVYLMKDERGKIIYIGKAIDLRQRVRSYFQAAHNLTPKVRALVEKICDLDYTVTDTEVEALILESNLIKEYRPRYNIDLKDDKHYPYLRVTVQEKFPRIHVARRVEKDGARYFGPYPNAGAVKETIRLLHRLFPLRHCRGPLNAERAKRPCLNRHIGRCLAPCAGTVSLEEYRSLVDEVLLFLEGKEDKLLRDLVQRMAEAAEKLDFEKAARLRDQYRAVKAISEKQKIAIAAGGDRDIIALAAGEDSGCAQLFAVRNGKLTGREHFFLTNPTGEAAPELLTAFLHRYYTHAGDLPAEILLSEEVSEVELLAAWLSQKRGTKVRLHVPQRGAKKELMRLALDNAHLFLEQEVLRVKARDPQVALQALAEAVDLESPPLRIEGYDISHFQGEGTVASMVVFENGLAQTAEYRRFRIRSVDKPDDYASMKEVINRRFARLKAARAAGDLPVTTSDPFLLVPDLILIDGGRGQLNVALQALTEQDYALLPVIALSEEEELLHLPDQPQPLRLPRTSPALQLLQRVRDESHRYAITQQRKQLNRPARGSLLLEVPGIGEKRRKALLQAFGSIKALREATVEELAAVAGMNQAVAATLYAYFQEDADRK
ncbi:MAG TPA: excinuclease ABC subunit UvrC [Oscillospiraceae bacterium]|nr:excinuclease ABC subunit UvrC [Oscillospiraceae bacterium]